MSTCPGDLRRLRHREKGEEGCEIPGRAVGGQDKGLPIHVRKASLIRIQGKVSNPEGKKIIQSSLAPLGQGLTLSLGVAPIQAQVL